MTTRTDHSLAITALRNEGSIESRAAADLLELHDTTGLNLYQAPTLREFVQEYATMAVGDDVEIEPNNA